MTGDACESVEERMRTALAQGQHLQAYELLARTYYPMVFRYCAAMLGGEKAQAEDATQQVFVAAGKGLSKFREVASVKAWLLAIAHKVCLGTIDKKRRRGLLWHKHQETIASHVHPAPCRGPDAERPPDEQQQQQLAVALTTLPPAARSLLVMRFGIGLEQEATIADLVQITGRSRASVYRDLQEALQTLKGIMNDVVYG